MSRSSSQYKARRNCNVSLTLWLEISKHDAHQMQILQRCHHFGSIKFSIVFFEYSTRSVLQSCFAMAFSTMDSIRIYFAAYLERTRRPHKTPCRNTDADDSEMSDTEAQ